MRTTLALADDVLTAAKALARAQNRTLGDVVSDLARRSLRQPRPVSERNGIRLLPISKATAAVTLEMVNELRDDFL